MPRGVRGFRVLVDWRKKKPNPEHVRTIAVRWFSRYQIKKYAYVVIDAMRARQEIRIDNVIVAYAGEPRACTASGTGTSRETGSATKDESCVENINKNKIKLRH